MAMTACQRPVTRQRATMSTAYGSTSPTRRSRTPRAWAWSSTRTGASAAGPARWPARRRTNVGIGLYWLRVLTVGGDTMDVPAGTFPDLTLAYQSTNCFHCDNPPCVKACPTQATYKMDNGIVNVDYDRCIGCRYCMVACPYDNRVFNWRTPVQEPPADVAVVGETPARPKGVVEKCTFCVQRVDRGPAAALRRRLPDRRARLRRPGRSRQRGLDPAARAAVLRRLPRARDRAEPALPDPHRPER